MELRDLFFFGSRNEPKEIKESIALKEVPSSGSGGGKTTQITSSNIKGLWIKAVGFSGSDSSGEFEAPEYDLEEIKSACLADSYIAIAVQKYSQLIFKAGYSIISDNDKAAEYIRQRMRYMSFATKTPMDILFQEIGEDLVRYSNAFLIKSRVDNAQLGGIQAQGVFDTKPVGGYFRVDPTTIKVKRDKNGVIKNYQQEVGNNNKSFKDVDVIHFYVDKEGTSAFCRPRLTPVLEDVKMLRKIEGNVLAQIYRYSNPITQVKIGLEDPEAWATDQDIQDAKKEFEKLNNDGVIITNERTNILSIGADGEALNIKPYLEYMEQRVFTALNCSASMMGRGGAKQDADSMEEQEHDTVKFFQGQIATFIESQMFLEMLLEGGFDPIGKPEDIVRFKFEEINLETRIKRETHALNLYQGKLIPFEEARFKIGKDANAVDENRLYMNMLVTPHDLAVAQAKGVNSATGAATTSSRTTSSKAQPSNQHGTTTMKVKEGLNLTESDSNNSLESKLNQNVLDYQTQFSNVYKRWNAVRNDIIENNEDLELVLPISRDAIIHEFKSDTAIKLREGILKALADTKKSSDELKKPISSKLIDDKIDRIVTGVFKDVKKKLKRSQTITKEDKANAFDTVEYRIRFLANHIISKSYWYGYTKACQQLKVPQVFVQFGASDDKDKHESIIDTNKFSLDDIPGFHPYCTCTIALEKEKKSNKKKVVT